MYERVLPPNYSLRPAIREDAQAVVDLLVACDLAEDGETDYSLEMLQTDWQRPNFKLDQDAWVVTVRNGNAQEQVVGYQEIWNRDGATSALLIADGYVHPHHRGLGIGTAMQRRLDQRARQIAARAADGVPVVMRAGTGGKDTAAHELHRNEGYQAVRYSWRMEIVLDEPPLAPKWPAGITLRPFLTGQDDRPIFDALEEAFRDHWGYVPWNYEWWHSRSIEKSTFDPELVILALDGDEIAGAVVNEAMDEKGFVHTLGVRRPWRRQGLGLALLLRSFGLLYERGYRRIQLGVDAGNPTGATQLYEKAGMYVAHEYVVFEKELRLGAE